jgi:hypothetical protein
MSDTPPALFFDFNNDGLLICSGERGPLHLDEKGRGDFTGVSGRFREPPQT